MAVSEHQFRHALSRFSSGVTVVTTRNAAGHAYGITVSAFCSVSLVPPMVLVCIGNDLHSQTLLAEGCCFAINMLREDQAGLSDRFAGRVPGVIDRLQGLTYRAGITDSPILEDCLAWLECRITRVMTAGDHTIYVAVVEAASLESEAGPLLYFRSDYRTVAG